MQTTQETVLCRVAEQLSRANVLWALGGSMLLCELHLLDSCSTIDLLLDPQHVARADEILSALGEKRPRELSRAYASQFFHTYLIDGVAFNLIGGMTLHYKGFLYRYRFDRSAIVSMLPLGSVYIPCTAPEDWWVLYQMMPERGDRFAAVDKYLSSRGIAHPERFEVLRQQPLPPAVLAGIGRLHSLAPRRSLA